MQFFGNLFGAKQDENLTEEAQAQAQAQAGFDPAQTPPTPSVGAQSLAPQLPARNAPHYGIDDAIKLMRTLPVDENVDLVVRVIKRTLESLSVRVQDIIADATQRTEALNEKIVEHKTAIVALEREIDARRQEIGRLEEAHAETSNVCERLQQAEAIPNLPAKPVGPVKKADFVPGRSAPPLPTTFRPKLGSDANTTKKPAFPAPVQASPPPSAVEQAAPTPTSTMAAPVVPPPPPTDPGGGSDDEPVASTDMITATDKEP